MTWTLVSNVYLSSSQDLSQCLFTFDWLLSSSWSGDSRIGKSRILDLISRKFLKLTLNWTKAGPQATDGKILDLSPILEGRAASFASQAIGIEPSHIQVDQGVTNFMSTSLNHPHAHPQLRCLVVDNVLDDVAEIRAGGGRHEHGGIIRPVPG